MKRPDLATQNLQPLKICTAKTKKGARLLNLAPFEYGVDEGDRTLDNGSHNPVLYQLSYAHHLTLLVPKLPNGAPGRTRTCDHPLRRRMLYPAELRAPC